MVTVVKSCPKMSNKEVNKREKRRTTSKKGKKWRKRKCEKVKKCKNGEEKVKNIFKNQKSGKKE